MRPLPKILDFLGLGVPATGIDTPKALKAIGEKE